MCVFAAPAECLRSLLCLEKCIAFAARSSVGRASRRRLWISRLWLLMEACRCREEPAAHTHHCSVITHGRSWTRLIGLKCMEVCKRTCCAHTPLQCHHAWWVSMKRSNERHDHCFKKPCLSLTCAAVYRSSDAQPCSHSWCALYLRVQLYNLAQTGFQPARFFSVDRVFRNEAIDRTHLAEFHQVEGACLCVCLCVCLQLSSYLF